MASFSRFERASENIAAAPVSSATKKLAMPAYALAAPRGWEAKKMPQPMHTAQADKTAHQGTLGITPSALPREETPRRWRRWGRWARWGRWNFSAVKGQALTWGRPPHRWVLRRQIPDTVQAGESSVQGEAFAVESHVSLERIVRADDDG